MILQRAIVIAISVWLFSGASVFAADSASGSVTVQKLGAISPKHANAYVVRDMRNPRQTRTEILLSDVAVDVTTVRAALDPHTAAINLEPLNDRNYVLLWAAPDGSVTMNATFSKT